MKVLIIASYPGSVLSFRGRLIEALIEAGCEVHVAAPGITTLNDVRDVLVAKGVRMHDIPLRRTGTNLLADLWLLFFLVRLIRRIRPSVTLPYTVKPVVYGALAAWIARVPHRYALITGLGYAFVGKKMALAKCIVRILYRVALSRTRKVIFQNPDDERDFRVSRILPTAVPSVVVNGSGIDLNAFNSEPFRSSAPVFLMISRLLGNKGVREYAAAARRMKGEGSVARFLLVGWIDASPDAIAQLELDEWIAEGCIEFLGRHSDVRPVIASCTVYVLPSYREGTPRTVLEAMAMGRAIITTDAPGCRETVVDGDNGFLVPVKSVDALVGAMLRFTDESGLAPRMGARSRRIAEEKYDVHKVNEVMLREMGITDQGISRVTQHG